jgi:hypothetical protein
MNCIGLTSVTISESITSIGTHAFEGCAALTSVMIPNSVVEIGGGAFARCSSLTSITIPNSVTSIGQSVFWSAGLTSITIPDNVTSIDYGAFEDCVNLTSVTIPESVTEIGTNAFKGCTGLTSVTFLNPTPPGMKFYEVFDVNTNRPLTLYVPKGSRDAYLDFFNNTYGDMWEEYARIEEIRKWQVGTKIALSFLTTLVLFVAVFVIIKMSRNASMRDK